MSEKVCIPESATCFLTLFPSRRKRYHRLSALTQFLVATFFLLCSFLLTVDLTSLPSSLLPPLSSTAARDCAPAPIPSGLHTLPQGKVCSVKAGDGLRGEADEPLGLLLVSDFRHITS